MNSNPFDPQGNSSSHSSNYSSYGNGQPNNANYPSQTATANTDTANRLGSSLPQPSPAAAPKPAAEPTSKLAIELNKFNRVAASLRESLVRANSFEARCQQAFDLANDLFGNAPTWVCFYRAFLGGSGMIHSILTDNDEFGRFLRTDQYHQIQLMLTALRSRDLPENDPNDPQRMITVRLPKSLHEAMCDEAGRLNISVNRLCISRMLQLLDPKMIPETTSKPRGRKPRSRQKAAQATQATENTQTTQATRTPQSPNANQAPQAMQSPQTPQTRYSPQTTQPPRNF